MNETIKLTDFKRCEFTNKVFNMYHFKNKKDGNKKARLK